MHLNRPRISKKVIGTRRNTDKQLKGHAPFRYQTNQATASIVGPCGERLSTSPLETAERTHTIDGAHHQQHWYCDDEYRCRDHHGDENGVRIHQPSSSASAVRCRSATGSWRGSAATVFEARVVPGNLITKLMPVVMVAAMVDVCVVDEDQCSLT